MSAFEFIFTGLASFTLGEVILIALVSVALLKLFRAR